jgi:Xaa-Pro aminopeptidase
MHDNPFSDREISARLTRVRKELERRKLHAAIFASPENVFYLTGLDHWGYFAPHLLIVPLAGENILITRAMERVSVEKQVRSAAFRGHSDSESAADMAAILSGRLDLTVEDRVYRVRKGDAFYFSSTRLHGFRNPSSRHKAVVLWVITPPSF